MTAIGDDLRAVIKRARTNPVRWGENRPRGLRQEDLAEMTRVSTAWIRQIESGYKQQAHAGTIGNICYVLGIDAEYVRQLGYGDIADVVADCAAAATLLHDEEPARDETAEAYIRNAPGMTEDEKEQLVATLRSSRRSEPIGKHLWRRR